MLISVLHLQAAKVCIENIHALYATEEFEFSKKSLKLYLCYLEEVLLSIEEILPQGMIVVFFLLYSIQFPY